MRALELRDLTTPEILVKLDAARTEMFNLRIAFNTNSLDDPNQIRRLRKDIARMLTVLRERELAAALVQSEEALQPPSVPVPMIGTPHAAEPAEATVQHTPADEEEVENEQ